MMRTVVPGDGKEPSCLLWPGWAAQAEVDSWWDRIPWRQNRIRVFGRWHDEPRWSAWFGPAYRYAGVEWPASPLPDDLSQLARRVEAQIDPSRVAPGFSLNSVLINGYRNGQDAMGFHRDNEPEMDPSCIASLSLGAARTFQIRRRDRSERWEVDLAHGDLLLMYHLQHDHEHALPRRLRVQDRRINFTFRHIASVRGDGR